MGIGTAAALLLVGFATFARANVFRDKPLLPLTAEQSAQLSMVGMVERRTSISEKTENIIRGSAIIVSPCYIFTNYHVVALNEKGQTSSNLDVDRDYTMTFRGGSGDDDFGFAGHTSAKPVIWGVYDRIGRNDWAIMKLSNCVGQLDAFGWLEVTRFLQSYLVRRGGTVTTVAYVNDNHLIYSQGRFRGIDPISGQLLFDGSLVHGMSGGAALVFEDGAIKLAGLTTSGLRTRDGQDRFSTWSADRSNLVQGAFEILNREDVKALLDRDKAAFGRPNPAAERLKSALSTLP